MKWFSHRKQKQSLSFYFHLRSDRQWKPQRNQIIYVETDYNESINSFILNNINTIDCFFFEKGLTFFYLPRFVDQLSQGDILQYNFPGVAIEQDAIKLPQYYYTFLLQNLVSELPLKHGLIRFKQFEKPKPSFSYFELNEKEIWKQLQDYVSRIGESIKFSLGSYGPSENNTEFEFEGQSQQIIDEIKERVAKLRIAGVGELLIQDLFSKPIILSQLVVTSDYRILLPDFNLEIELYPLPKSLYILFLTHHEGIRLKQLIDYKDELLEIYIAINPCIDRKEAFASIQDMTDPTSNSINEKCSRIREAFVKRIDIRLAEHYIITGRRGEVKKILIDRSLVTINVPVKS